jgi:2-enoate reductase
MKPRQINSRREHMNKEFQKLFNPIKIGNVRLKNRIVMAPMGLEYMVDPHGNLNQRVVDYYLERARHGVGMIICSVFKVENRVEALEECIPMIRETSVGYLSELCDVAHSFGARIFVQLTAGFGRVTVPATLRGPCVSASPNPNFWDPSIICTALTTEEIGKIVTAMGETASRLVTAEVDGIELHGHEGYLFDQFTSNIWNKRTDHYGGSLENRLRFPIECLNEIRHRVADRLAVQYRFGLKHYIKENNQAALPGETFEEKGRDIVEGLDMARMLESAGFDALHVDAGSYESHYWSHPPNYQKHGCMVDLAASAKESVTIPVVGVGRLDKPEVAAQAIIDKKVDLVAIGRGLLADPHWADKVKSGTTEDIRPCVGCYNGCFANYAKIRHISCALNPSSGRERVYRLEPTHKPLDVMVIGAGIAGMEAARVAAIRGHRVSIHEKAASLGGLVQKVAVPDFKRDLRRLLTWYERQIDNSSVKVFLKSEMTADTIRAAKPDVTIVATGARVIVPEIPGIKRDSVVTSVDLLNNGAETAGKRVVIVGGGLVGCEIAIWLANAGKQPVLVEMLPELMEDGSHVPIQVKTMTMDLLSQCGATILTDSLVSEITEKGILVQNGGKTPSLEADTVVLAVGMASVTTLADQIEPILSRVYRIGDCRAPRNVMNAVWDAYEIARFI